MFVSPINIDIMKNITLLLTSLILATFTQLPVKAQQAEIVEGNYVYRVLDAHRACVDLFAGQTYGAYYIIEAWHSPQPGNHNVCKAKGTNTTSYQIGSEVGVSGGIVNGSVNGSTSQNTNGNVKIGTISLPKNRACNQQQGTPHAYYDRSGYIYCRHNR
jgi:hypothetical protein